MNEALNSKTANRLESIQKITDAAVSLFGELGYSRTSIAAIAKKAGVAVGLVMKYFQSKENLFITSYYGVLTRSYKCMQEYEKVPDCLLRNIQETKKLIAINPEGFKLLKNVITTTDLPEVFLESVKERFHNGHIYTALREAQRRGLVPEGDCYGLYLAFLSNMYSHIDIANTYDIPLPDDEYFLKAIYLKEETRGNVVSLPKVQQFSVTEVRKALQADQFRIYYQPIIECDTGKVFAAEALIRWEHPLKGIIAPDNFIPLMEDKGFISEIDSFVVKHIWNNHRDRLDDNKAVVPVTVNLSWMDFYDNDLVNWLLDKAKHGSYLKGLLYCEVTETSYAALKNNVSQIFREFKELNIKSLLDDFGTGVSSLDTLQKYSFDILKIDMSFTQEISTNPKTRSMILAIIDMCHQLGLKVIAEGVETQEQYEFYKNNNCDYIQGFYFFKPMPESEFFTLLDNESNEGRLIDYGKAEGLLPSSYFKSYIYFPNEEMRLKANQDTSNIIRLIGENSGVGAVSGMYNEERSLCFFGNFFAQLFGYTNQELVAFSKGSYINLIDPEDREGYLNDDSQIRYYSIIGKDGQTYRVKEIRLDVTNANGEKQWVAAIRKMDSNSLGKSFKTKVLPKSIENFDERVYVDGLTGVLNRNFYIDHVRDLQTTALAILDVDKFKAVNDGYGHLAGDEALRAVASVINDSVRGKDLVIRYGGDEFVIVFNGVPAHALLDRLENIRKKVSEVVIEDYPELKLTCSIGGIVCGDASKNNLRLADELLYEAKLIRNKVVVRLE